MPRPGSRHPEWAARTDGSTRYSGDLRPANLLVGAVLRSPYPRARIVGIDMAAALRSPGVRAVVTAADLPDRRYTDYGMSDRPALARDEVRFIGHEVAAVAAESAPEAQAALAGIRVRYAPLRSAVTREEALERDVGLRLDGTGNVAVSLERRFGDAQQAARPDLHRVSGRYRFGSQAHACMEPHTTLADWDPDAQMLQVWTPTQGPRTVQRELAHLLGFELEQVRIRQIAAGGDFGSRVRPGDIEVLAAALAIKSGRPVRLGLSRDDEFAHTKHRHDFAIDLTSTADAHGQLVGREASITVENGGFTQAGGNELSYCSLVLASQYRLASAHITGEAVYTNRRSGGAFRGAGGPQAVFAIESQLDELADQAGMDPVELRLRNANRTGDTTIAGWEIDSSRLADCLRTARDRIGWNAKRAMGGSGRGVGIAAAVHVSGALSSEYVTEAETTVELGADGTIRVRTGAADPGTGQPSVAGIMVADQLGVDAADVEVVYEDTALTPYDPGAGASKGTYMTGSAALGAGRAAAQYLREQAAAKFSAAAESVRLEGGRVCAGSDDISIGDLVVAAADTVDGTLTIQHRHTVGLPLANDPSGHGNLSPSYAFAAHAVEVEVDRSTGQVRVLQVIPVHDSGTIINPTAASGQVVGGVVMGIGAALGEELVFTEGRLANGSYTEYALPRAGDVPDVTPVFLESSDGRGPLGAKGLAEIALSPTPAAIANAVAHAVGARVRDLPITPDKVLAVLAASTPESSGPSRRRRLNLSRLWISAMRWAYPRGLHALLHRYGTWFARGRRPAPPIDLRRPTTARHAVDTLSSEPTSRPLGGGTDLLVARRQGIRPEHVLVDLTSVPELTKLEITPSGDLLVGAAVTLSQLAESASGADDVLASTVDAIASPQLRAMSTVAGNLCQEKRCGYFRHGFPCYKNGGPTCPCYAVLGDHRFYHAALGAHRCQATTPSDLATTLTALDATVHVDGPPGARAVPIDGLYRGPGETVLRADEVITHVVVPAASRRRVTRFEKLRLYDGGFALVAACASVQIGDDGVIADCRAVLGGVAPTPYRAACTEDMLLERRPTRELIELAARAWTSEAHPLPGNRWKLQAASTLLARAVVGCAWPGPPTAPT